MPLDPSKPFKIVYIDIGPVIEQEGKKYTLEGIEIVVEENNNEPTTDKTTSSTTSGKKQPRSRKQP